MSRHKIVKLINKLIRFLCRPLIPCPGLCFALQQTQWGSSGSHGLISEFHEGWGRPGPPLPRQAA
jgi:hypothetical protein